MACFSGPEIVNNGLVFYYDMNNRVKSWKGKPTTNEFVTGMLNGAYGGDGTLQPGAVDAFGKNSPVYRKTGKIRFGNTSGTDEGTLYYGGDYVFSVYMRLTTNHTNTSGFEFDIVDRQSTTWVEGEVITDNIRNHMTYEWKRFSVYANHNNNSNYRFIDIGIYQNTTNEFEWCCPMIEQGTWPSPYIPWSSTHQSRSNTEALLDVSGQGNTITTPTLTYNSDGSFEFDGSSSYLDLNTDFIISPDNQGWTAEYWFKTYTPNTIQHFNSAENDEFNANWLAIYNGKLAVWNRSPGYWKYGSTEIQSSVWYQAVFICDTGGTNMRFYINGAAEGGDHVGNVWNASYSSLESRYIGRYEFNNAYSRYFNGKIASVRFYNRALTANEVKQNFENTRGKYGV